MNTQSIKALLDRDPELGFLEISNALGRALVLRNLERHDFRELHKLVTGTVPAHARSKGMRDTLLELLCSVEAMYLNLAEDQYGHDLPS